VQTLNWFADKPTMILYKTMLKALLLALMVQQGVTSCTTENQKDIVIVGAGYAGVAAAREIEKYNRDTGSSISYVVLLGGQ